uniref:(northern house mosquito) hypothetical protein n=1 Tax=Culex pipiens TaxID=7175 RepID=A0A8D8AHX1_CULPI
MQIPDFSSQAITRFLVKLVDTNRKDTTISSTPHNSLLLRRVNIRFILKKQNYKNTEKSFYLLLYITDIKPLTLSNRFQLQTQHNTLLLTISSPHLLRKKKREVNRKATLKTSRFNKQC